ncbi:hypothetical protein CBOM_02270 [Ceraceosorus bombacis]|uniref:Coiled-coil domain-containing protein 16 n=1 Tax=Ceraceosorus bombacis TaxID=401625 RepID=A0A0P1BEV6_9BASI|nr:hypothetical protein CBOM_02270 [Ceraceosorus bombacis]
MGISDPYAVYVGRNRALRCKACDASIKHEALWSSHASSKSHRGNVTRLKAELREAEEQRLADEARSELVDDAAAGTETDRKRTAEELESESSALGIAGRSDASESKRQRTTHSSHDDQRMEEEDEWARFQAEVLNAPSTSESGVAKYVDSTIEVAPVLRSQNGSVPSQSEQAQQPEEIDQVGAVETEEEKRERLDKEAKEEIYARMEEEQRLQDEADERVTALRARLDRFKAVRSARQKLADESAARGKPNGSSLLSSKRGS